MAAAAGSVAAAAMAVAAAADTGKFRGFPRKARLLRQAGFSRWVEDEQILVEIRRACFKIALYQGTTSVVPQRPENNGL
jgi:hypothetical protein